MKIKIHPRLKAMLSKHLMQRLPKITMPVQVNLQSFKQYWDKCPLSLKRNSLFFFSKDLVKLINDTNDKLLYGEVANKKL